MALYHVSQFFRGLRDSFRFRFFFQKLSNENVKKACIDCTKLILGIFLGSLFVYNLILRPFFISQYGDGYFLYLYAILWNVLWVLPSYIVTFIYSMKWYNEIAKSIIGEVKEKGRAKISKEEKRDFLKSASEYKTSLILCISILTSIFSLIPYVGSVLSFLWNAWLYAYYSFEYRWNMEVRKSPSQFIAYIQYYWSYFLGFGAPLSLVTLNFSFSASFGVFSVLFPFFLIASLSPNTKPYTKDAPSRNYIINIFEIPEFFNKHMLKFIAWFILPSNKVNNSNDDRKNGPQESADK